MSEYIQAYIKAEHLNELKDSKDLLILIHLSRIVNSLRSSLRSYMAIEHEDFIIKMKDRIDILLVHGSFLYEAIKSLLNHSQRIHNLDNWDEISEEYRFFNKQYNENNSFTKTILNKIRNKLFFHFDLTELSDTMQHFDLESDLRFIIAKTESKGDVIYSFADDLVLTYLTTLDNESSGSYEKLDEIQDTIIKMSDRICSLCDKIMNEIIKGKFYKKKSEI